MVVDYAEGKRDPRTPEQMAKDYSDAVGGRFSGQRKVVHRSAEEMQIAFVDGQDRVQAVLAYHNDSQIGWILTGGINCA